ncbi:MAG TPA: FAD-dependent oxidoreductase [Clostridia bacterium]|nr:FAD-dependent oxidoreductase [Clostridia bacterium]
MKIAIVGGAAGGATAAARLRRISEEYEIVMFEKDAFISYASCGLPYFIGGVIKDRDDLEVQTPADMKTRFNIDVRTNSLVAAIDVNEKVLTVRDLKSARDYRESFDKILLSCGAKPIVPPIKGIDKAKNVFTLRTIPDTMNIKSFIENNKAKKAVVVGGGFIGVEMAENLRETGLDVTLIEKTAQALAQFDFEMAQIAHREMENNGVAVILNDGVSEFADEGKIVVLDSQRQIECDIAILCIGVAPENTLAKDAGIKLGQKGHLVTDKNFNVFLENGEKLQDIYAIGDMIEVINGVDNTPYAVPLAWGANRQGRLVADAISGREIREQKILGNSVLKIFNLTAAAVGMNERTLKAKNIDFTAAHAHRGNHAGYYPGASNIALKLLFDKDSGKIYGAQGVGGAGTEKRIDLIGAVMRLGGTIYDLAAMEVCYAPPFSSAKDPVNILGYIAENIAEGAYKPVFHYEIDYVAKDCVVLDVRAPFEYNRGHIENALNVNIDELREKADLLPDDKNEPVYIYCQVGLRGYLAANILRSMGYNNIYNLSGGYITYKSYKYEAGKK